MSLRKFTKNQKVRFIGEPDEALPGVQKGDVGVIWSTGVGKSWIWVVFDTHPRPMAVHHHEVEFVD